MGPGQGPKGKLVERKSPSRHGSACGSSNELATGSFGDEESKKDHPMVPRYPGSYQLGNPGQYREFDQYTLVLGKIKGDEQAEKTQLLEGRVYSVLYNNPQGRSLLEILKNYEQGLTRADFQVLYSCTDRECGG